MTKAQALALINALETAGVPASVTLSFPAAGGALWTVNLDTATVYTGAQLDSLVSYCSAHGLVVSAQFASVGVV